MGAGTRGAVRDCFLLVGMSDGSQSPAAARRAQEAGAALASDDSVVQAKALFVLRTALQMLALALAWVFWCEVGTFHLAAARCSYPDVGGADALHALVISDVHVLGVEARGWIDRAWTDWQVSRCSRTVPRLAASASAALHATPCSRCERS